VHVPMMEQVVAIEPIEEPGFFQLACFGQVHAPVNVLVGSIVSDERGQGTDGKLPTSKAPC
jgi:hypothetical protein